MNDAELSALEQKFFYKMWKNLKTDVPYHQVRDEMFGQQHVFIYICYPLSAFVVQKIRVNTTHTLVLRRTATKKWELEVCHKTGVTSKVVNLTPEDLQMVKDKVAFNGGCFEQQPNVFGSVEIRAPRPKPIRT